jgi:hypothetical protein
MPFLHKALPVTYNKPIPTIVKEFPYNLQLIRKRIIPTIKKSPHPRCRPFNQT